MRGAAESMRVLRPVSSAEALALYARSPDAIPVAGGTDFMVGWNAGLLNGRTVLDLSALEEWRRMRERRGSIWIGALVHHLQIQRSAMVRERLPLLVEACSTIGGIQIQARGTLGGNIANASPAADTFPPLAVYEAIVHTISSRGRRRIPFLDVFTGVKRTSLEPGELIEGVEIPFLPARPARSTFRKVGTREASAISKTVAAGLLWRRRDGAIRELRFAFGSMAPTVRRLRRIESLVAGRKPNAKLLAEAGELLAEELSPIDDLRSTAEYRLAVSRNLLLDFLRPR